jgi:hypothetical protein
MIRDRHLKKRIGIHLSFCSRDNIKPSRVYSSKLLSTFTVERQLKHNIKTLRLFGLHSQDLESLGTIGICHHIIWTIP